MLEPVKGSTALLAARPSAVHFVRSMKSFTAVTNRLQRALGKRVVRTDDSACHAASFDSSKLPFLPEAVIFPRTNKDLNVALTLANEHGVPVTVRGRGTS